MFNEPILTFEQAKVYFQSMGCNGFHMSREYPERYDEYKKLNISRKTELEWIEEQFNQYCMRIKENIEISDLWWFHSKMEELITSVGTDLAIKNMLEATQSIKDIVPYKDRVLISETINGRSQREYHSGLIYYAYGLGDIQSAKAFVELSLHFSEYSFFKGLDFKRCRVAKKKCRIIRSELGL
ncbi:MAG: hypothetical protein ACM3UZ_04785 [Acidobacteriota bacterium]